MKFLNISSSLEEKFKNYYIQDHSKFIHTSWLLKEDLGKTTKLNGINWKIVGLWDVNGINRHILLRSEENGTYAFEDSKIVAKGMGIFNMRNLVTGEEHKNWVFGKSIMPIEIFEDTDEKNEDYEDYENNEENNPDEYVDPVIQALISDISDED